MINRLNNISRLVNSLVELWFITGQLETSQHDFNVFLFLVDGNSWKVLGGLGFPGGSSLHDDFEFIFNLWTWSEGSEHNAVCVCVDLLKPFDTVNKTSCWFSLSKQHSNSEMQFILTGWWKWCPSSESIKKRETEQFLHPQEQENDHNALQLDWIWVKLSYFFSYVCLHTYRTIRCKLRVEMKVCT